MLITVKSFACTLQCNIAGIQHIVFVAIIFHIIFLLIIFHHVARHAATLPFGINSALEHSRNCEFWYFVSFIIIFIVIFLSVLSLI